MAALVRVGTFVAGAASFDSRLGETPSAILLVSSCASDGDGPLHSFRSSIGAADGSSQWAASLTYPFNDAGDFVRDIEIGGFDATLAVRIFADDKSVLFTGEVDAFNADGTVDMSWTGVPEGEVGFIAWSGIDAEVSTVTLGNDLAGISTPQTITPGFEPRAVIGAFAGARSGGVNDAGAGMHCGIYVPDANAVTGAVEHSNGQTAGLTAGIRWDQANPVTIPLDHAIDTRAELLVGGTAGPIYRTYRGDGAFETRWAVDLTSFDATSFELRRHINDGNFTISHEVGLLVLGGPFVLTVDPDTTTITGATGLAAWMVPRGGFAVGEWGSFNAASGITLGAWDDTGAQWCATWLVTQTPGQSQHPTEHWSRTARGFYDGRLVQLFTDEDTETGYQEIQPVAGQADDPTIALTGTYPAASLRSSYWPTFIVPLVTFGPVSFSGLSYPKQSGDVHRTVAWEVDPGL